MKKVKIHEPYQRFKGFALANNIKYADIAKLLGITPSTVSMKINGYSDFYLSEQRLLKERYGATEDIFL